MKKTILAAAMLAGALSAQAEFVASDNVYGIINVPIIAGMNAVGVSLLPMSESANLVHDVILPEGLTAGDQSGANGLWVYGTTYTKYYLSSGNVWTNSSGSPVATLGLGMWIKATTATNIYQIGILPTATTQSVAVAFGHNFIANPYPCDLDLTGTDSLIDWNGVGSAGKNALNGDLLRIWNVTKYDTYYYFQNATTNGWFSSDNKGRMPDPIPAGESFFFQRKDVSITAPIKVVSPF